MVRQLEQIRRDWDTLAFNEFIIKAQDEINRERSDQANKNFSMNEVIAAYDGPLYLNQRGRPDLYIKRRRIAEKRLWNDDIINQHRLIYKIEVPQIEVDGTRVVHDYIRVLRGGQHVRQIDQHSENVQNGIQHVRDRIQDSRNTRRVDRAVDELLEQLEARQRDADDRRRRGGRGRRR